MKKIKISLCCLFLCFLSISCQSKRKVIHSRNWHAATKEVIHQFGPSAEKNLRPYFHKAGVRFPPRRVALLAFKKEKKLELWAKEKKQWRFIKKYRLTASSGKPGPKLIQFDRQIPEGVYRITTLNPFSSFHLSMKINYPNSFDRYYAQLDGRHRLGGDIFIHGKALSVGCLAIGDRGIEELFVLISKVGQNNAEVIIAPNDMRTTAAVRPQKTKRSIKWLAKLDAKIYHALQPFKQT